MVGWDGSGVRATTTDKTRKVRQTRWQAAQCENPVGKQFPTQCEGIMRAMARKIDRNGQKIENQRFVSNRVPLWRNASAFRGGGGGALARGAPTFTNTRCSPALISNERQPAWAVPASSNAGGLPASSTTAVGPRASRT